MRWKVILVISLTLIFGWGCGLATFNWSTQRTPVTCAQIQENELRTLVASDSMKLEAFPQWFDKSSFGEAELTVATNDVFWTKNGIRYQVDFDRDFAYVTWNTISKIVLEPTGSAIITCFGRPDLYRAIRLPDQGGPYIELTLWYPEKGVIVLAAPIRDYPQSPIDGSVIMSRMTVLAPRVAEDIVNMVYPGHVRTQVLGSLHPWPAEGWQDVTPTSEEN